MWLGYWANLNNSFYLLRKGKLLVFIGFKEFYHLKSVLRSRLSKCFLVEINLKKKTWKIHKIKNITRKSKKLNWKKNLNKKEESKVEAHVFKWSLAFWVSQAKIRLNRSAQSYILNHHHSLNSNTELDVCFAWEVRIQHFKSNQNWLLM